MARDYNLDSTTGLDNFFGFLAAATAATRGRGTVLACDVNRLSQTNAVHGFAMGDRCLLELAGLVRETARTAGEAGRAFRLRKDEFAVLLPGVSPAAARDLADQLADRYANRMEELGLPESGIRTTVVAYPEDAASVGDLLAVLDFSLYVRRGGTSPVADVVSPRELPFWARILIDDMVDRVLETVGALQRAQELAFTDAVSGLPNHRAVEDYLNDQLTLHHSARRPLSVLFVDGDHLKKYNEELGYEAGNEMIRRLGQVLLDQVRSGDYVARWLSGDEFLMVLPNAGPHEARQVAERLREAVERAAANWPLPVTVSVGIASYPEDGHRPADLLRKAADANAQAKRRGRNRVE